MESSGGRHNQAVRVYAGVIKLFQCGCVQTTANGRTWPFLPVNEGLNGAESDFRFVLETLIKTILKGKSVAPCDGNVVPP